MPNEFAYYGAPITITVSIIAMIAALIAVWVKNSEAKGFLTFAAAVLSVGAGYGWSSNIYELLDIRNSLYRKLGDSQQDVAQKKSEIDALNPYKSAYERAVQSALTTAPTKDGDRTVFQVVMLNIPANFPNEGIKRDCKDRSMVKDALDPLVAQGKIVAGNRPAWDALMNCALITSGR